MRPVKVVLTDIGANEEFYPALVVYNNTISRNNIMRTTIRVAVVVVLIALVIVLGKNIANQASKFKDIYQAESEARELAQENENLKSDLGKEKSSFSLEKEARDKLSYQKKGEVLYVTSDQGDPKKTGEKKTRQNWEEWVELILRWVSAAYLFLLTYGDFELILGFWTIVISKWDTIRAFLTFSFDHTTVASTIG